MHFELSQVDTAVIIGAGHGIGLALCQELLNRREDLIVYGTYRDQKKAGELMLFQDHYPGRLIVCRLDPTDEAQIENLAKLIRSQRQKIELVFNCVGFLHDSEYQPEKNLREVTVEGLMRAFMVNSVVMSILAKHFLSLFRHQTPSCFATLSAKVGSIGDNSLGGWYAYRASKAALNMFVKNVSIEYQRFSCNTLVLALHPGTTNTDLSQPYQRNLKHQLHSPEDTARNLLALVEQKPISATGSFWSWDGEDLPW